MRLIPSLKLSSLALAAAVLTSPACASDPTAPTPDLIVPTLEVFAGPMDPGGLSTYLFTTNQLGSIELMLAGVVAGSPLESLSPVLHLSISRWNGTECVPVVETDTMPRLTAALRAYAEAGTYCAMVSDPNNNLTQPVGVTLRMVSPAIVSTGAEPGAVTFSSTIAPAGTTSRSFITSRQGELTATFDSISAGDIEMGLAIGMVTVNGCGPVRIVHTRPGPGPQLTARVDPGEYCVALFDLGNLTRAESFTVSYRYP